MKNLLVFMVRDPLTVVLVLIFALGIGYMAHIDSIFRQGVSIVVVAGLILAGLCWVVRQFGRFMLRLMRVPIPEEKSQDMIL